MASPGGRGPGPEPPLLVGTTGPAVALDRVLDAAKDHLAATTAMLDPERTGGRPHLTAAARHALQRLGAGTARTRDPAMEVLLHAAGTDQIAEALTRVGLSGDVDRVVLVLLAADEGVEAFVGAIGHRLDDGVLAADPKRAVRLAQERGHDATADDAMEWLIEDCAMAALE